MSKDDIYKDVFICRLQFKEGLNIKSSESEFGSTDGSVGFCRGSRVEGESIFLSRVDGRGSHVEGRESKVEDRGSYLLLNDDFFSEDFFSLPISPVRSTCSSPI